MDRLLVCAARFLASAALCRYSSDRDDMQDEHWEGRLGSSDSPNRAPASAQSMRDSAQVTAPGAIASMIVAVSTRPNRQNRSTCSRMSVPLVQKQKLRLVSRIN